MCKGESAGGESIVEDSLIGMEVVFEIAPSVIPYQTGQGTVQEGGFVCLSTELLRVGNQYYQSQNLMFYVAHPPEHGRLENSDHPRSVVTRFTFEQVVILSVLL